jgi:hypothetical protein
MRDLIFASAALCALVQPAYAKTILVMPGNGAQERLQEALIAAEPGDIVELGAGRFALTDGLSLDVDGVTLKGQGGGETTLDFSGQQGTLVIVTSRFLEVGSEPHLDPGKLFRESF